MKYIISVTIAALLFSTSCNKYEEGPILSLKTKKSRVANTWVVDKAYDKDEDVTDNFDQYELYTTKDGDANLKATYSIGDFSFEFETDGTWDFQDKKENIYFDYEDDAADKKYQVLKLTEDELYLRESGGDLELHLKSK
jgi:hypothetical protein